MIRAKRPAVGVALLVVLALLLAACSATGGRRAAEAVANPVAGHANTPRYTVAMITHARVKIGLFMAVGLMAWFTGMHTLFLFNTIQSGQGVGNEFVYIIAAVVGGCLLTGGYGSAAGAAIGALLLGVILLNTYIRRRAEASI